MLRVFSISAVCLALISGCATTQNLVSKVSLKENSSSTPIEQVLKAQPDLKTELNTVEIRQVFNRVESPDVGQITVLQAGLLDDSINAIRTTYSFRLDGENWKIVNKKEEYKCGRGENTKTFQTKLCP